MRTVFSDRHTSHAPKLEFNRGSLVPAFERWERAQHILAAVESAHLGNITAAPEFPLSYIESVHAGHYVQFLQNAHTQWCAAGHSGEAFPVAWPIRAMRQDRIPRSIEGQLSYYSFDGMSPITAGTWEAAKAAADVALQGATLLEEEQSVFALCRPPGHHAASDCLGGYCYLNNAAVAAQHLKHLGAERVGILDVDYHHGNGTQEIFYRRRDVFFASIHATPETDYPYFLGYADETGVGEGEGYNHNFPLPRGTDWHTWQEALEVACRAVTDFSADALVVSLGVDTFAGDPLGGFGLSSPDYLRIGRRLAQLRRPTLFVMEGGYSMEAIGLNVVNVLKGYEGG